jgi:hypothetical protein
MKKMRSPYTKDTRATKETCKNSEISLKKTNLQIMSIEGNEASQRCIQHIQQNNN